MGQRPRPWAKARMTSSLPGNAPVHAGEFTRGRRRPARRSRLRRCAPGRRKWRAIPCPSLADPRRSAVRPPCAAPVKDALVVVVCLAVAKSRRAPRHRRQIESAASISGSSSRAAASSSAAAARAQEPRQQLQQCRARFQQRGRGSPRWQVGQQLFPAQAWRARAPGSGERASSCGLNGVESRSGRQSLLSARSLPELQPRCARQGLGSVKQGGQARRQAHRRWLPALPQLPAPIPKLAAISAS